MSFRKPFRAVPIKIGAHYAVQRRRRRRMSMAGKALGLACAGAALGAVWLYWPHDPAYTRTGVGGWSYPNCSAARAAGAAPVRSDQPGYGPHLDADSDGIGCEPFMGLR